MAGNRAVTFMGPQKMEIQDKGYPKLEDPKGRKIECAVILELVTTNICGSAVHIYTAALPRRPSSISRVRWLGPSPRRGSSRRHSLPVNARSCTITAF